MPRFRPDDLLSTCRTIIERLGATPEDALTVADHLVGANLVGHDSHGVLRLVQYAAHVREGKIDPRARVKLVRETATTAVIDGNASWGQVVAKEAFDRAITKARTHGIAAICVRNCYHIGRVGVYPEAAAEKGFIAQVHCNGYGVARVAPWGGTEPKLATNPIAIAIPTRGDPVVVDVTTSVVAEGKVRLAKAAGRPVPEGWVLDRNGVPTTQPGDLYDGGSLLPLGGREGHKGYGLGVIVDLLGGVLSGAGCGFLSKDFGNGLFIQVTDPAAFEERDTFLARVTQYLDYLRTSALRPGVERILLPGEPERIVSERRRREGLEIDDGSWKQVIGVGESVGLALS
jgi:uncharacterized oxidoreductase